MSAPRDHRGIPEAYFIEDNIEAFMKKGVREGKGRFDRSGYPPSRQAASEHAEARLDVVVLRGVYRHATHVRLDTGAAIVHTTAVSEVQVPRSQSFDRAEGVCFWVMMGRRWSSSEVSFSVDAQCATVGRGGHAGRLSDKSSTLKEDLSMLRFLSTKPVGLDEHACLLHHAC
jgi:hypothetical protein